MLRGDLSSFVVHFQLAAAPNTLLLSLFSPQTWSSCENTLSNTLDTLRDPRLPTSSKLTGSPRPLLQAGDGWGCFSGSAGNTDGACSFSTEAPQGLAESRPNDAVKSTVSSSGPARGGGLGVVALPVLVRMQQLARPRLLACPQWGPG